MAPVLPKSLEFARDLPEINSKIEKNPQTSLQTEKNTSSESAKPSKTRTKPENTAENTAEKLLHAIEFKPLSLDEIVDATGLDIVAATNLTLELELAGLIVPIAGGRYQKC